MVMASGTKRSAISFQLRAGLKSPTREGGFRRYRPGFQPRATGRKERPWRGRQMKHRMYDDEKQGKNGRAAVGTVAFLVMGGLGMLGMATRPAGAEEVSLRYTLDPGGPPISTPGQDMVASDA